MRRLPVYLMLDTSGSMMGEPIEAVKNGVQVMMGGLRQDPQAIETAFLSVITFDTSAQQVMPLTDLASFQMPEIRASGVTALGDALSVLSDCLKRDIVNTTASTKGDWKPMVFLMTDGVPTDDWQAGLSKLDRKKIAMIVACAAGGDADTSVLKQITENVISLDTTDSSSIAAFFEWVSASISVSSTSVENAGKETVDLNDLPPPPSELNIVV